MPIAATPHSPILKGRTTFPLEALVSSFLRSHALVATLAIAALVAPAPAGDLTPPTGPIEPTLKDLDEVEPRTPLNLENTPGDASSVFKITNAGSYYLIGNLKGVSGKHGILIDSDDVTIDLMGFHVSGVAGSLRGITTTGVNLENIAITNGTIDGWGQDGIWLLNSLNGVMTDLRASNNATAGIRVGSGTSISRCVAFNNTFAILTGLGCTISNCTAYQNTGWAIEAGPGTLVEHCAAYDNGSQGFVGNSAIITHCTVRNSDYHGISAYHSTVSHCNVYACSKSGIWVGNDCNVINNNCTENTEAGIFANTKGNRIESNNCTDNDKGIHVSGDANYIIRNICTDNTTNFDIAINNRYGAIMNHTMTGTPSVNGNSASSFMGTTDPWANFANTSTP